MTIVSPPHSSGTSSCSVSCWRPSGSASSRSILLTATTIGTLGRLGVADRLDRLRHHAVVGRDHEDAMSVTWAPRARMAVNASWPGVSMNVIASPLCVDDVVGADVLRDAAGLAGDDVGLADRVEQRRLAVVDVTHDGDDGRGSSSARRLRRRRR